MTSAQPLQFKIASERAEMEQIHRLNHRTFVEEIPQHQPQTGELLVDEYDDENTYVICLDDNEVVGMIALRGKRPFSLDRKLPDLDAFLPPGRTICEVRLLSIKRAKRHGRVLPDLLAMAAESALESGYDLAVICGIVGQQKLYESLGFVPFGPVVGSGEALYQPMSLTLEDFYNGSRAVVRSLVAPVVSTTGATRRCLPSGGDSLDCRDLTHSLRSGGRSNLGPSLQKGSEARPLNFLPGPVAMHSEVRRAFSQAPESHRSESFVADFQQVGELLRKEVDALEVCILLGSGTLANDAIAGQLSLLGEPGLVLSNGEFGRRLIDHATRAGLSFETMETTWGEAFDPGQIQRAIQRTPDLGWIWAVHCETSTGVLNRFGSLGQECTESGIRLCLDCVSSIGTVAIDLSHVYLASGSSGKALGAYPGLALVYSDHALTSAAADLPRYLDLGYYASKQGIPFTHSSNLVYALRAALLRLERKEPFPALEALSTELRQRLCELGFCLVAAEADASPAIVTIDLPSEIDSRWLGGCLKRAGYLLSYESQYLLERNWIQISLMGVCSRAKLAFLLGELSTFAPIEAV